MVTPVPTVAVTVGSTTPSEKAAPTCTTPPPYAAAEASPSLWAELATTRTLPPTFAIETLFPIDALIVGVTLTRASTPPAEMKPPVPAVPLADAVLEPVDSIDTLPACVTWLPVSILASVVPRCTPWPAAPWTHEPPAPPSVLAVA